MCIDAVMIQVPALVSDQPKISDSCPNYSKYIAQLNIKDVRRITHHLEIRGIKISSPRLIHHIYPA